jgi:hypothetical protein
MERGGQANRHRYAVWQSGRHVSHLIRYLSSWAYKGRLLGVVGFGGLSASLTDFVARSLQAFGVCWMTCRRRWTKHMPVR